MGDTTATRRPQLGVRLVYGLRREPDLSAIPARREILAFLREQLKPTSSPARTAER